MTKKQAFLEIVGKEIFERSDIYVENYPDTFSDALDYYNALMASDDKSKEGFTEGGAKILMYMRDNKESSSNIFKAKSIGDGIGVSSRAVTGSMRKLVSAGYVEKIEGSPCVYSLTTLGENVEVVIDSKE